MKRFALVGFVLSLLVFATTLYLQFVVVPASESAEMRMMQMETEFFMNSNIDVYSSPVYQALFAQYEAKVLYGMYVFVAAIVAFLIAIYPAIQKNGLAILGVLLSVISFFIGALHGTHLFS